MTASSSSVLSTEESSIEQSSSSSSRSAEILKMLPIRMISRVVRGYGRGSTDLGIPTANLDREALQSSCPFDDLPTGIYWGYGRIIKPNGYEDDSPVYKAAISIGYCPTYGNTTKTVEPHLIAPENDPRRHASSTGETVLEDFYDQTIRLSVVGYLRPELPFEGLEKLVVAIKNDIKTTEELASTTTTSTTEDPTTTTTTSPASIPVIERSWVGSDSSL